MNRYISKQELFELIGVREPYRYTAHLLKIGAIVAKADTTGVLWGSTVTQESEPKYRIANQADFDKVVQEARAEEAEWRLGEERQLRFAELVNGETLKQLFGGAVKEVTRESPLDLLLGKGRK
jgi:hypothetical protein